MLIEIICDKFKQNKVEFHSGLNTILGDDIGSNSIGKSTFLMIVDFIYGGSDYIEKSLDIQKNVGNHTIKFAFRFKDTFYYFSRNTHIFNEIAQCDINYNVIKTISLTDYTDFLKKEYQLNLDFISFRNIVGRFSRVYGKDNLNEKKPLHIVQNEKSEESINCLLKIFNLFDVIAELEKTYTIVKEKLSSFKKAQKYNFLTSITKKKFTQNIFELDRLNIEKEEVTQNLSRGLLDLDSLETSEILDLKKQLSIARRQKTKFLSQLNLIKNDLLSPSEKKKKDYNEFLEFFPDFDLKKVEEIEKFHIELIDVLNFEFKNKKKELEALISLVDNQINSLTEEIEIVIKTPNLSSIVLKRYSTIQKNIEELEKENSSYTNLSSLNNDSKDYKEQRDKMKQEQLANLEISLNLKMKEINDFIYTNLKKSPILNFKDNNYTFHTPDDSGTGTNYKNMIIYDLSILEMTSLPILIHDSVVLKQISDVAIEKILEKYCSFNKQIFVSFDKKNAYSHKAQEILIKNKVLELNPNGQELFGISWNNK